MQHFLHKCLNITNNIIGDFMKHNIDLSKYKIRTDLAIETLDTNDKVINAWCENGINVNKVLIDKKLSKKTGKK